MVRRNPWAKECSAIPSRVIAACFALAGFTAAILVGLYVRLDADTAILRAIVVMVACYISGRLVGHVAQRVVDDHIQAYRASNPIPKNDYEIEAEQAAATVDKTKHKAA
ncbi:MAG: hypothetical protein GC164_05355 [Phycisphaera sp.]|nr:hypothetical protein [Phycisphaera sp.]